MRVTNSTPLGESTFLPVGTVNHVATLMARDKQVEHVQHSNHKLCHCPTPLNGLKVEHVQHSNHKPCHHHTDDATQPYDDVTQP
jgi:hypothetical protein